MELFISTRGDERGATAPEAVLRGIAPDGGLYIRREMPQIPVAELAGADFRALAERILGEYLSGYTAAAWRGPTIRSSMCRKSRL